MSVLRSIAISIVGVAVACTPGCGVGWTHRGDPVVGFRLIQSGSSAMGPLAAAATTAAAASSDPVLAVIAGLASLLLGGGLVGWRMERVARQREHQAWDEAMQTAARAQA